MKIRQCAVDLTGLHLSPEEGFVLSRVEGTSTVEELVALTGLEEQRVVEIVARLSAAGAIDLYPEPSAPEELSVPDAAPTEPDLPVDLDGGDAEASASPSETTTAPEAHDEREHRRTYEALFRAKTREERVAAAHSSGGAHLLALCLDPDPQVIDAILANPRVGIDAARLIAEHHRTSAGLEMIAKRTSFVVDAIVHRRLLRNPQLPPAVLHRLLTPKLIVDVYKIVVDREIPDRTRMMAREVLRKKFTIASSDERAALLFKTEGRCLPFLVNCSLDAHATQILASKSTYSVLFVQNLTRWSATPPLLLAHLLKLPVVRRNVGLRKLVLRHPNVPAESKRHG